MDRSPTLRRVSGYQPPPLPPSHPAAKILPWLTLFDFSRKVCAFWVAVQNCNAARFHYARRRLAVCFRPPTDIPSLQAARQKGAALGEGGIRPLAGVEETSKNQYLIGEKPQRR